jgi:hypothetical protein
VQVATRTRESSYNEQMPEQNAPGATPGQGRAAKAAQGSPSPELLETTLQEEIGKLRSSILRTINELDRFCMAVKRSREAVDAMSLVGEQPHEARDEPLRDEHRTHEQGEDKWYDTRTEK